MVEPLISPDWVGYKVGASPGTWRDLGKMRKAPPNVRPGEKSFVLEGPSDPDVPGMVLLDYQTDHHYLLNMAQEDLEKIRAFQEARGAAEPVEGDLVSEVEPLEESTYLLNRFAKVWSGAVDNRNDMGIARYGVNVSPFRSIGRIKQQGSTDDSPGLCSGVLVGNSGSTNVAYALTSADCLFDANENFIYTDFYPRHDTCLDNVGTPLPNCDKTPYGKWVATSAYITYYYLRYCLSGSPISDCARSDIAILKLQRQSGATFPGTLGYGAFSEASLNQNLKFHRGYPKCGNFDSPYVTPPVICLDGTLYGDGALGLLIYDEEPTQPDGYPHMYFHSSDSTPGQHGGPLYTSGYSGTYVFGVNTGRHICPDPENCPLPYPTAARAIDPGWYTEMYNFMSWEGT